MKLTVIEQGRIQDFKLGMHEHFWGISYEKSWFYAKKILFFPILWGGARASPPESAPAVCAKNIVTYKAFYTKIILFD